MTYTALSSFVNDFLLAMSFYHTMRLFVTIKENLPQSKSEVMTSMEFCGRKLLRKKNCCDQNTDFVKLD